MKKIFYFFIVALIMGSCGNLEPQRAESPFLKSFVFRNSIDEEWQKSLRDEFIGEVYLGNIKIEGFDIPLIDADQPRSIDEAVLIIFEDFTLNITGNEKECKAEYIAEFEDWMEPDNDTEWSWFSENPATLRASEVMCEKDIKRSKASFTKLINRFFEYITSEAEKEVKMISWEYDFINTGDSYDAYDVTYQVGSGYTLINLIEFTEGGKYEFKILNTANSLTEINDYI